MTRFERWSVWITSLLMVLTGSGYLWTKYFLHTEDPWAAVNHPLEPWLLKGHVLVAPFFIFAIGLISLRHVWRHLRNGGGLGYRSGLWVVSFVGPMVITGYVIQVVTHPVWLEALAVAHIALGFLFILGLAVHQWSVRAGAAASDAGAVPSSREATREAGAGGERELTHDVRPAFSRRL